MPTGSHLGNLYPFVQGQANHSKFELSFLRPEFTNIRRWQPGARARVLEHLFYAPPRVDPQPQVIRRTDKGDYVEEYPDVPDDTRPTRARLRARSEALELPAPGSSCCTAMTAFISGARRRSSRTNTSIHT